MGGGGGNSVHHNMTIMGGKQCPTQNDSIVNKLIVVSYSVSVKLVPGEESNVKYEPVCSR